ncbi:hypothetical protein DBR42_14290 [Pelomonas sp. HMWF004]|nr:hypothetical protein DBR42_14290 [Pelomonas sp. HMWF004]
MGEQGTLSALEVCMARSEAENMQARMAEGRLPSAATFADHLTAPPGMRLSADLMQVDRSLFQWLLDPLLAAKNRSSYENACASHTYLPWPC